MFRFAVVVLGGTLAFAGVAMISKWLVRVGPSWLWAGATAFMLPWLVLLTLAALWWPEARLRWRPVPRRPCAALFAAFVAIAGVTWLYFDSLKAIISLGPSVPSVAMAVASGVVFGPIVEEWIFRDILWRQLVPTEFARPRGVLVAVVATSTLFAVWHLPYNPAAPLFAHGVFGALMAAVRWQAGGVLPCVVLHGAANFLYFIQPS